MKKPRSQRCLPTFRFLVHAAKCVKSFLMSYLFDTKEFLFTSRPKNKIETSLKLECLFFSCFMQSLWWGKLGHQGAICWLKKELSMVHSIFFLGIKLFCFSRLVAVGSSGILKAKQKLGVTFNFNKQDIIDFKKFSKMIMCRASEANS